MHRTPSKCAGVAVFDGNAGPIVKKAKDEAAVIKAQAETDIVMMEAAQHQEEQDLANRMMEPSDEELADLAAQRHEMEEEAEHMRHQAKHDAHQVRHAAKEEALIKLAKDGGSVVECSLHDAGLFGNDIRTRARRYTRHAVHLHNYHLLFLRRFSVGMPVAA